MMFEKSDLSRRSLLKYGVATAAASSLPLLGSEGDLYAAPDPFKLNYICSSAMYGTMKLAEILPEVRKGRGRHD